MKYQTLFSGKNKKTYFKMSAADFFPNMLSLKETEVGSPYVL